MVIPEKKENGVVFTPEWVVDFMVEEAFKGKKLSGKEKILDAGCGEGVFAIIAAKKFAKLSSKSIEKVIEENIFFIDVESSYVEKTKQNLQGISKAKIKKYNDITDDFCFHNFKEQFDFIIGNPPYVRIQNLNGRKESLQKNYLTAANGSIDLYFCFFEQALRLLKQNGRIAFITPNSYFYSKAGKNLRGLLLPYLSKIVNFDHFQVFKNATAYTAITFLQKEHSDDCLYVENFKNNFDNLSYKQIKKQSLNKERWQFFDKDKLEKRIALNKRYATLHEIANIHYGIATLKDSIYIFLPDKSDAQYFYFDNNKIERDICVPIIKASTYKGENQNLFLIFPYDTEGKIIPKRVLQKLYPQAYKYLLEKRAILETRDKGGGKNYEEFYAFGRNQGLKTSFGKKIITSTMNISPRFYVVEDENTSFYAGYCIKPRQGTDIYQLCRALNSDLMQDYIEAVSKSYRGGYKSYAKSFLMGFMHPQFIRTQPVLI